MSAAAARRLAGSLHGHGTDAAFGVPGGGPNLEVIDALGEVGIRFVLGHGETATCIMASTYGLLTDQVAPALVTRGPGAASAVNGAAQATLDRNPLLLVTDTVPEASAHRVPHQRIDQRAMLAPVSKAAATLCEATTAEELAVLIGLAQSAPAGAVHLDCDADASGSRLDLPAAATSPAPEAGLSRASGLLAAASRPVVIVGLGAVSSGEGVRAVLQEYGAPVLTTYQAIGVVPTEDRLCAGLFTNGATERPLLEQADLVVTIGLDPVEPIPARWAYDAPVVSLASHPTVDPYLTAAAEIVGELAELASVLLRGGHDWDDDAGARHREMTREQIRAAPEPVLGPIGLVDTLRAGVPPEAVVTVDAGAHFLAIMPLWPVREPNGLLISNGLATMGYALPAAIGAALARPGRPVVCLVGDGGLGMTLAELETVARLGLPVTVVVFNDSALSLIAVKQRVGQGGEAAVRYGPVDFAAVAASMGVPGRAVGTVSELEAALRDRSGEPPGGPRLIDARIDPGSYPHLLRVTRG